MTVKSFVTAGYLDAATWIMLRMWPLKVSLLLKPSYVSRNTTPSTAMTPMMWMFFPLIGGLITVAR